MDVQCEAAWHAASRFSQALELDEARFKQRHRLYWLADFADLFLVRLRTDRWLNGFLRLEGDALPQQGPILALTFHYGAGLWAMREFGRRGLNIAWLHAPVADHAPPGERLSAALGRMRIREVIKATRAPAIPTGGSYQRMSDWLDTGGSVTALFDVPHFGQRRSMPIEVLGHTLHVPDGLIRLAEDKQVPVYLYTTSLVGDGPHRRFFVRGPIEPRSREGLVHAISQFMHEEIRRDPAAWHFWPFLDSFTTSQRI